MGKNKKFNFIDTCCASLANLSVDSTAWLNNSLVDSAAWFNKSWVFLEACEINSWALLPAWMAASWALFAAWSATRWACSVTSDAAFAVNCNAATLIIFKQKVKFVSFMMLKFIKMLYWYSNTNLSIENLLDIILEFLANFVEALRSYGRNRNLMIFYLPCEFYALFPMQIPCK